MNGQTHMCFVGIFNAQIHNISIEYHGQLKRHTVTVYIGLIFKIIIAAGVDSTSIENGSSNYWNL